VARGSLHRTVASGEDEYLALAGCDHFNLRLSPWSLLYEHKLPAFIVLSQFTQKTRSLPGERDFSVKILMETIEVSCLIVEKKGSGSRLTVFLTYFQEILVSLRESTPCL